MPSGYVQTAPPGGFYTVTVVSGQAVTLLEEQKDVPGEEHQILLNHFRVLAAADDPGAGERQQLENKAQAKLNALKNPTPADLSAAQSKLDQAQTALQSTQNSASQAKTNAQLALQNAVNSLTQAQSKYATAQQNWQHVQDTGTDPANPTCNTTTTYSWVCTSGSAYGAPSDTCGAGNVGGNSVDGTCCTNFTQTPFADTRVRKLDRGEKQRLPGGGEVGPADALIMARSGLERVGLPGVHAPPMLRTKLPDGLRIRRTSTAKGENQLM